MSIKNFKYGHWYEHLLAFHFKYLMCSIGISQKLCKKDGNKPKEAGVGPS